MTTKKYTYAGWLLRSSLYDTFAVILLIITHLLLEHKYNLQSTKKRLCFGAKRRIIETTERVTAKMSLTRNIALEKEVYEQIVPEAHELAEYFTGTYLERVLLDDCHTLVAFVKQHDYKSAYPALGHIKKQLAEARSEQERVENGE